jgi:hypothetical protein
MRVLSYEGAKVWRRIFVEALAVSVDPEKSNRHAREENEPKASRAMR